jgi:SAM-dependent methyltransferase
MSDTDLKAVIKERYGKAAQRAASGGGCCGTVADGGGEATATTGLGQLRPPVSCCSPGAQPASFDPITLNLYETSETDGVPDDVVAASLGCGNPVALAQPLPGETVLDLGSGAGLDVLLTARRVGPAGKVYGLDMTDEMLALARENARKAGASNVEFLRGEIEKIPLPDDSLDLIISNCVINLSPDKDAVLAEAFRVLKPGGRIAVMDIVVRGELPAPVRRSMELWAGCISGALEESDYRAKLAAAGFGGIAIEPWRIYEAQDVGTFLSGSDLGPGVTAEEVGGKFASAAIRAVKPQRGR